MGSFVSSPSNTFILVSVVSRYDKNGKPDVELHWMDGGIQPTRPYELGSNELMGDGGNGAIFIETKGKICVALMA